MLICFDFDNTLINKQTHSAIIGNFILPATNKDVLIVNGTIDEANQHSDYNKDAVILKAQELLNSSDFEENKKDIKETFENLLSDGHSVTITSFNKYPEMIELFLDKLELNEKNRKNINVICGYPSDMEVGKKEHIEKAMELSGIQDKTKVILLDDDIKNIIKAEQERVAGLLVDERFKWNAATDILKAKIILGPKQVVSATIKPTMLQQPKADFKLRPLLKKPRTMNKS